MNSEKPSEAERQAVKDLILKMFQDNKGTNFAYCFRKHLSILQQYNAALKERGGEAFPDRDTYQAFSVAKLFFDKLDYMVFQKCNATLPMDELLDESMPPLEAFHWTEEDLKVKKEQALKSMNVDDILHLKVTEEISDSFKLQVINKYGDKSRIVDCAIEASLFKNYFVKEIDPPLQVDDIIRATVFGTRNDTKLVTLNPAKAPESVKLGRISKGEIEFYPEDIRDFSNFAEYLRTHTKFHSPKQINEYLTSSGCNFLETGPLYKTEYKANLPDLNTGQSKTEVALCLEKIKHAYTLLWNGEPLNALLKIQEVLESNPENDVALTLRGKIYLAKNGGKKSSMVRKAICDFQEALNINPDNAEAWSLLSAFILESSCSFTKMNMPEKSEKLKPFIKNICILDETETFLKKVREGYFQQKMADRMEID